VRRYPLVIWLALFAVAGIALAVKLNILSTDNSLKPYFGKNVQIEGLITGDVVSKGRLNSFDLSIRSINGHRAAAFIKVYAETSNFNLGDYVLLEGVLKAPLFENVSSPQAAIFSQKRISRFGGNSFWLAIGKARRWVKKSLLEKGNQGRAFLYAMLTGQTDALLPETKDDLRASGLAHLWSVSGLHTGFVALLVLLLLRLAGFRAGWQLVFIILSLFLFSAFTGFEPPVIRASIMASWLSAAYLLGRKKSMLSALAASAILSLAINPLALFDPSFQLSYAAVGSLLIFTDKIAAFIEGVPKQLNMLLSASLAAQILTMPLLAFYFGEVPLFAAPANMLVIPMAMVTFYLTILALIAKAAGLSVFLTVPTLLSAYMLKVAAFFNSFSVSTISVSPLLISLLLIAIAAGIIFLYKKERTLNFSYLLIAILLVIAIQQWWPVADNVIAGRRLKVEFLDVGQGDATLITGPQNERILIDGGPEPYKVQQDLRERKIKSLDLVAPSHADADHIGGLPEVVRNFEVKAVLDNGFKKSSFMYRDFLNTVRRKKIRYILARRGQRITVGTLKFAVLSPPTGFIKDTDADDNNNSVVLKLNYQKRSFLFTGDLGFAGEESLMETSTSIKADVLKVAHHGSARGSSPEFLQAVQPQIATISAGAGNQYGHPKPALLSRLKAIHAKIYRTDLTSDITVTVDKQGLQVYD